MSNYLLFAGKNDYVESLKKHFEERFEGNEKEISIAKVSNANSICVIERRNESVKSSIFCHDTGEGLFFRGQALDYDSSSMIMGLNGFAEFQTKNKNYRNPLELVDFEGTYALARWNTEILTVQTDVYSIYRLLYYNTGEIVIVSDSLVLIVECMKKLGIEREINDEVAHIKAWNASGLPNAPISDELIVKGVFSLQVGKYLQIRWKDEEYSVQHIHRDVTEMFTSNSNSYVEVLRDCVIRMYTSINFLIKSFNPIIEFGLSGGIDSRVLLALCLQSEDIMNSTLINTNKHPTKADDYAVVKKLAERYGFSFNDSERKKTLMERCDVKKIKITNPLGLWKLASLGVYDSFYLTPHYYSHPAILHMVGVGAEPVKQAMDNSRIEKTARSQHPKTKNAVQQNLRSTISNLGIDPLEPTAMKWYHMTYKAAYHLGFKTAQSSMLLRPFVQKRIFSIALAADNPFKGKSNTGPTALHDMILLLDPTLASMAYDSPSKDISSEYAAERLIELGGPIQLHALPSPEIYGNIQSIANGPANTFLQVVREFSLNDNKTIREQLLEQVKNIYEFKIPKNLKDIYESCYMNTIDYLSDESIALAPAGALAARFLAFEFFD